MIDAGLLKNPDVDAALMIHVMTNMPMTPGTVIVCDGGVSAPACDFFTIKIQGKGCHGSMPNTGIDPVNIAAHTIMPFRSSAQGNLPLWMKQYLQWEPFTLATLPMSFPIR